MKKILLVLLMTAPVVLCGANLGIGVILGSPTGLSFKYLVSRTSALAAHAGWDFRHDTGIHVTGDYQHLFPMVIETEEGTAIDDFTPYIAVGGRFRFKEVVATDDNEFHLGLRVGGGVEYNVSQFGIFLEVLPVVDLIPSTDFDIEGGLGFLFYF
jgi:opacity protein-like surface antigen